LAVALDDEVEPLAHAADAEASDEDNSLLDELLLS